MTRRKAPSRTSAYSSPWRGVVPDGCTIDTEGFPWVALYEGSRAIRFSPEVKLVPRSI
ncbi:hypothetical protein B9Z19DRAFT_1096221 [Tuber borchii]|uniref:SMP-30/Gluconolactonase/LRE-like region domain-containing protein n=1 Tax=Tuber borchii TaxID=42251 RepID=A0A2T6ZBS7_TUBBO|nr:hypothetical protein B9Z19DRAFT_1096221 [Tuber borchii]